MRWSNLMQSIWHSTRTSKGPTDSISKLVGRPVHVLIDGLVFPNFSNEGHIRLTPYSHAEAEIVFIHFCHLLNTLYWIRLTAFWWNDSIRDSDMAIFRVYNYSTLGPPLSPSSFLMIPCSCRRKMPSLIYLV
jgi:hypothetical protein